MVAAGASTAVPPNAPESRCLEAALDYGRRGLPVLPVWGAKGGGCACGKSRCPHPGKHPIGALVRHGVKHATTDLDTIVSWWRSYPHASVAIATGKPSGIDVLDVDGDEGIASLRVYETEHGELPVTPLSITGSLGQHYVFRHRPGLKNVVRFAPGLDVRTTASYIVAPPSLHVSGRPYAWDASAHPDDIEPAAWPDALYDLIAEASTTRKKKAPAERGCEASISKGRRNDTLTSLAGTMRRRGMGEDTIAAALLVENTRICEPPLDDAEIRCIAASVARYPPASEGDQPKPSQNVPETGRIRTAIHQPFARGDHRELAERLLSKVDPGRGLLVFDEGSVHGYEAATGLWQPILHSRLRVIVSSFAGSPKADGKPVRIRMNDAQGAVGLASDMVHRAEFFNDAPPGIAFSNGFVTLNSQGEMRRMSHAPRQRQRWGYSFPFDPDASCPEFDEFLLATFDGDDDAAQKVATLEEFGGACLFGKATEYERALILLGPGASGKSTTTKVASGVMPPKSVCAIAPQNMAQEYYLARLAGKRLNFVAELPDTKVIQSEVVKGVISGDLQTGRHIREAPFDFKPTAGHLFAANRLPQSADQTDAYYRRWIVLRHNNVCPETERDPQLADRILAHEIPGIVGRFVRGAARLIRNGGYSIPPSSTATVTDWRHAASSVAVFLDVYTRPSRTGEAGTLSSDLHAAYGTWARAEGFVPCAQNVFGGHLASAGLMSKHTNRGNVYPLVIVRNSEDAR